MKRFILAAPLVLGTAFLVAWSSQEPKEVGPLVSLAGSFSSVKKPRVEVIGDNKRWQEVWKEHTGDKVERNAMNTEVIPEIDFSRCMVVAMFSGDGANSTGWHVVSVSERDGHTLIRYDQTGFQSASFEGKDSGSKTSAYGLATVERSSLPMILEENEQSLIDAAPIWKEKQRLPALPPSTMKPGPRPVR